MTGILAMRKSKHERNLQEYLQKEIKYDEIKKQIRYRSIKKPQCN